jgi:hypothetical protein
MSHTRRLEDNKLIIIIHQKTKKRKKKEKEMEGYESLYLSLKIAIFSKYFQHSQ